MSLQCPRCNSPKVASFHRAMKIAAAVGAVGGAARGANTALAGGQIGATAGAVAGPLGITLGSISGAIHSFPEQKALFRSDTKTPLSVVSNRYQIVQPRNCGHSLLGQQSQIVVKSHQMECLPGM